MNAGPREQLVNAARALQRVGMNVGTAGNLSVREGQGMLITPSGVDYGRMQAADIVFVGPDGRTEGQTLPSSEWRFHLAIYRQFEDAGAIVHTHSSCATALACLGRKIPAFHYEVALAGGSDIPCAPYATYGTGELSNNVLKALQVRRACLLANHGLVCHATDIHSALALAQKVEHLAQIYLKCLAAGEPVILDEAEMARVAEKFRDYGKR